MKRKKNKGISVSQSMPFQLGSRVELIERYGGEPIIRTVKEYVMRCTAYDIRHCHCPAKGKVIEDERGQAWCIYQARDRENGKVEICWKLSDAKNKKNKSILKEKIKAILASKPIPTYQRKVKEPTMVGKQRRLGLQYD